MKQSLFLLLIAGLLFGAQPRQQNTNVFENRMLATWDTGLLEEIVQDSSRYNLILFSASWCPPCIRIVPLLKEIYRDIGDKLIMTYVSVDEERTAEAWRTKMRTNEIPWRSLMAWGRHAEIYSGPIPRAKLVHPNTMNWEFLDVRRERDRRRLYELVR